MRASVSGVPLSKSREVAVISNDYSPTPLPAIIKGTSFYEALAGASGGLPPVNEQTVLRLSAVYACVALLAGVLAAFPKNVFRRKVDGQREQAMNEDLWWKLNEEFCPRWSAASGWEFTYSSLLLRGDGFIRIDRSGASASGFTPKHPDETIVVPSKDGKRLIYRFAADGGSFANGVTLDQDDVIHIPGFGFDGTHGMSPLRHWLRMTGAAGLAAQDYSARFFANGARPDLALETDALMAPDKVEEMLEQWAARFQGVDRSHRPAVLHNGLKIKPITLPAKDLQLLEVRQFSVEEIARVFGVPPVMIGQMSKTTAWGTGIEMLGRGLNRYTFRPHINRSTQELNRKLFRTASRFIEFDVAMIEEGDLKSQYEADRIAIGRAGEPGFMTVNEVRRRHNLAPKVGGDELSTGAGTATTPAKEPEAPPAPDNPEEDEEDAAEK